MKSEKLSKAYEIMKEMSDAELHQLSNTIRLYIKHVRQVEYIKNARVIWGKAKEFFDKEGLVNIEEGRDKFSVRCRRCMMYLLYYEEVHGISMKSIAEATNQKVSSVGQGVREILQLKDDRHPQHKETMSSLGRVRRVLDKVMERENE